MLDVNTYYYDVITESSVTIDFNLVLNYVREQLLTEGKTNITLLDICDYFDDNIETSIKDIANCSDFIGDDNEYILECISDDFRKYLEKHYGENYESERL